jgi:hypothetical protein
MNYNSQGALEATQSFLEECPRAFRVGSPYPKLKPLSGFGLCSECFWKIDLLG